MPTVLSAAAGPRRDREARWRHLVATTLGDMDLTFVSTPGERERMIVGELGPIQVLETRSGPGEARWSDHALREKDPDRWFLFVQGEGDTVSGQEGRRARFRTGDIGLTDMSRPFHCTYTERRAVLVTYPKALSPLGGRDLDRLAGVSIPGRSGTAALASSLVRELPGQLASYGGSEAARAGAAVLDLVSVALAAHLERVPKLPPETRTHALLLSCRRYIEEHLSDPRLTPESVAVAHHISLRYLHRLFEPGGEGVAALIRRRRLARCRQDLLDPALVARPVSAIGARWGLPDAAHFSRIFKAAHGLPPAAYRALHLER
jgi:AraC-like DNA-binding protein